VRRAGILLHPTSLPGPFGIGDLGSATDAFLDWAAVAGATVWQVLPLGPVGERSHSPYDGISAFAGNPLLISPERLVVDGLLSPSALDEAPGFAAERVDYPAVRAWKERLLEEAWQRFRRHGTSATRERLRAFAADTRRAPWLADWELFCALKRRYDGAPWNAWPSALARREPAALAEAREELTAETGFHRFVQFLFFSQWARVHGTASRRGLRILGDVPIYVAHDSADVWAHRELFDLDEDGRPQHVAGVPPDYFCPAGQRWGNPLYRWDRMASDGYEWWVSRLRGNLELTDLVRIDHFRAFAAYWEVPADQPDARAGRWAPGPGLPFFAALRRGVGGLPIVAEDLGVITSDVEALRDTVGLPGMRVLQFAFDEDNSSHLPHRHRARSVVYTGTHDNDTTGGWYATLSREARARFRDYLGSRGQEPHWDLVRAACTSAAELAVLPLQDLLGLGSTARMNRPGEVKGNWEWRLLPDQLTGVAPRLRRLLEVSGRLPKPVPEDDSP
jgi:4-alpha-glucanotransferase